MMQKLDLFAEPYSASGSLAAPGVLNQLGRPNYEVLELFIRESVQNSWDARDKDSVPLYGVDVVTLSEDQRSFLKTKVYGQLPPHPKLEWRPSEMQSALMVYDRGTVGLEGPTRADVVPPDGEFPRFADFVFNAGQSGIRKFSAGTYGYGKAAYYLASRFRTICIHTRCRVKNRMQSRFVAIALGTPYNAHSKPYTGRWWWGREDSKNNFEPLLNDEADEAARMLGMPKFGTLERGTSILILEPAWGDRNPKQALNFLIERLLYFAWPKMISIGGQEPAMLFEAKLDGQKAAIPNPRAFNPLQGFVEAYENLVGLNDITPGLNTLKDIGSQRPKKHLGRLSLQKIVSAQHNTLDTEKEPQAYLGGRSHHIALMRQPELIVQYFDGSPLPNEYFEYCGVFKVDQAVDEIFAQAETPVHDKWEAEPLLDRAHKTYVRAVPRYVKKEAEEFVRAFSPVGTAETAPLGSLANELGMLLTTEFGPGAGIIDLDSDKPPKGNGKGPRAYRANIRILSNRLFLHHDEPAIEYLFEVKHAPSSKGTQLHASVGVLLDGGEIEIDPPQSSISPTFVAWKDSKGAMVYEPIFLTSSADTGPYSLIVSAPSGVAVRTEINTEVVPNS